MTTLVCPRGHDQRYSRGAACRLCAMLGVGIHMFLACERQPSRFLTVMQSLVASPPQTARRGLAHSHTSEWTAASLPSEIPRALFTESRTKLLQLRRGPALLVRVLAHARNHTQPPADMQLSLAACRAIDAGMICAYVAAHDIGVLSDSDVATLCRVFAMCAPPAVAAPAPPTAPANPTAPALASSAASGVPVVAPRGQRPGPRDREATVMHASPWPALFIDHVRSGLVQFAMEVPILPSPALVSPRVH
eukprot:m.64485 g.64485  ORF g.64485 m.64485 type:complete len:249 (+) comp7265_c0_seq1:1149-1895(+)